jgi:hypothetical protein
VKQRPVYVVSLEAGQGAMLARMPTPQRSQAA